MSNSVLSEFLSSFPNNSVTIERFAEVVNSIGEKEKTWTPIYSNLACIFILRNQFGDDNEIADKQKVKSQYECRIELESIGESPDATKISNVTEKDRAIVGGRIYSIQFVNAELGDTNLIDHCNLYLQLVE